MVEIRRMLTATRGRGRLDWTDWLSYAYLLLGLVLMFGPVLWLVLSSFKSAAALNEFPPQLLPYGQATATVPGNPDQLRFTACACPTARRASWSSCGESASRRPWPIRSIRKISSG